MPSHSFEHFKAKHYLSHEKLRVVVDISKTFKVALIHLI